LHLNHAIVPTTRAPEAATGSRSETHIPAACRALVRQEGQPGKFVVSRLSCRVKNTFQPAYIIEHLFLICQAKSQKSGHLSRFEGKSGTSGLSKSFTTVCLEVLT
jgi:hypothetical protein